MGRQGVFAVLIGIGLGMAYFAAGPVTRPAAAQTSGAQSQAGTSKENPAYYDLQRSTQIDRYQVVAKSGVGRGENLYFYKCWMCHNDYTITSQYGESAPFLRLKDLFKREKLTTSGQPVNDATITDKIKNGGPGMPSFQTTMSEADIQDLLSYLKSGKCCVDGEDPPANPWYKAPGQDWTMDTQSRAGLQGGPRGLVRDASGAVLEGMIVQLIAPTGVRVSVYTNEDGNYEFPQLPAARYTLRISRPLDFFPYQRDSVPVQGATKFEEIVLERRPAVEDYVLVGESGLAPVQEVSSQLSGSELLFNLSGTAQEKELLHRACGSGCHSYQQILRNRYDERSWRLIAERMMQYQSAPIINRSKGTSTRGNAEQADILIKWLARVRGPDSKYAPLRVFPRARRAATRVVVTEYELPRVLMSAHDVAGDSKGNIWFTSHKTAYVGQLDPRTGIVKEYKVPRTPGALSGTHRVLVDKNDIVWFSENWSHKLTRLDPRTGQFMQMPLEVESPLNSAGFSNFGLAPDGDIYETNAGYVIRIRPENGVAKIVNQYKMGKEPSTYDNMISDDGNFWVGGGPASGGTTMKLLDIRTGKMETLELPRHMAAARGGMDRKGDAWFGGRGGSIVQLDTKKRRIREYWPPVATAEFYEAMPDDKGEVWAGELHGSGFLRLNPKTDQWIEYQMPEPFAHDRRTWIDNSTDPISVWYVDYQGYIVRIQPLD